MSNYGLAQKEMDAVGRELRLGSILQTIGWTLLVFVSIPVSFVWVGFRSGTYFWLYWTLIEGTAGFVLVLAGSYMKSKSGRFITRAMDEEHERKAA